MKKIHLLAYIFVLNILPSVNCYISYYRVAYVNKCEKMMLDQYMAECWSNSISNTVVRKLETPQNVIPSLETAPSKGGHVLIVNNVRVPIRHKVVSNKHSSYIYFPLHNPFFIVSPYSILYPWNYSWFMGVSMPIRRSKTQLFEMSIVPYGLCCLAHSPPPTLQLKCLLL